MDKPDQIGGNDSPEQYYEKSEDELLFEAAMASLGDDEESEGIKLADIDLNIPAFLGIRQRTRFRSINSMEAFAGLELYIDTGTADMQEIQSVLSALNELSFAAGGLGFEFEVEGYYIMAKVPVGAR